MKPCEIEIFDRHYNYRSNALIDKNNFSDAFDALSIDKNQIQIPKGRITIREKAESGSIGDGTAACSDYVRIIAGNMEYVGVVVNIEENEIYTTLTYEPLHSLLNHEVIVLADDIKHTTIEKYIKDIITNEFVGNADTYQNIPNLSVETTSSTTGIMDYNDTSEVYAIINLLNDLIYPAFREYLICTKVNIDFQNKELHISIGEEDANELTVEADLPNVVSKNFTIRSASSMVNKLSLYDTKNYALSEYDFYLHPSDYSFDNVNNDDRFFPVVNQVGEFDSDAISEDAFLEIANDSIRAINKYIDISRDLSDNELAELNQGLSNFMPYLIASKTPEDWKEYFDEVGEKFHDYIFTYWYGFAGNNYQRVDNYDDLVEEGTGHYFFGKSDVSIPQGYTAFKIKENVLGLYSSFSTHPPIVDTTIDLYGTLKYNTTTHADFYVDALYQLAIIFDGAGRDISTYYLHARVYVPISTKVISTALNEYKKTEQFQHDFEAYKAANLLAIISGYAKKVFKTSKYTNLIELTTKEDDAMIQPLEIEIGQTVNIIHDGTSYSSVLSGRQVQKNGLVKLIFGTIRIELTKVLNMKGV